MIDVLAPLELIHNMAEYFRDDAKQDVLLLIDNIFRFVQAGAEVSGLMGQLSSSVGYQPTLATELAQLEERICNTNTGAIDWSIAVSTLIGFATSKFTIIHLRSGGIKSWK